VAGINGDFYVTDRGLYIGDPRGLQIMEGELVSGPADQSTFWIDTAGNPQMSNVLSHFKVTWPDGTATPIGINEERPLRGVVLYTPRVGASTRASGGREFLLERGGEGNWLPLRPGLTYVAKVAAISDNGDTPLRPQQMVLSVGPWLAGRFTNVPAGAELKISMAMAPDLAGVRTAISGGSVLIRNGKKEELKVPLSFAYKYRSVTERHPRSAIGASSKYYYLVEVDGRQRGLSAGMTLAELADYMVGLGCELGMNLDGGNSATLWLNGKVMNSPSGQRPRDIANGLVVVQKEKTKNQ
jgi:hypothetical protein